MTRLGIAMMVESLREIGAFNASAEDRLNAIMRVLDKIAKEAESKPSKEE
jgi:hypothetical protein